MNEQASDNQTGIAEHSELARGAFAAFFERNKPGIQYVSIETMTYYISRRWTLRGPIPKGAKIEHTGLEGATHSKPLRQRGPRKRKH